MVHTTLGFIFEGGGGGGAGLLLLLLLLLELELFVPTEGEDELFIIAL
jgi:hypothetical protein